MHFFFSLEQSHYKEINTYKEDAERWKEEISNLQELMNQYRRDIVDLESDVRKKLKEKDDKIHELLVTIRQTKVVAFNLRVRCSQRNISD